MFGLGDTTFANFNMCSKTYYIFFKLYEMDEVFPYEIGSDHDGNIEMDFLPWKESLLKFIQSNNSISNLKSNHKNFLKGISVMLVNKDEMVPKKEENLTFAYKKYNKMSSGEIISVMPCF